MTVPSRRLALGLAAVAALACGDIAAPVRDDLYEWRLEAPSFPGPGLDTLSFHWDQADLPVRVWVRGRRRPSGPHGPRDRRLGGGVPLR